MSTYLRHAVAAALGRLDFRAALLELYADVQRQIDARRPACAISGRCCRFEEYGHRLYLTTIELAVFVADLRAKHSPDEVARLMAASDGAGCPFQINKLCSVHPFRPFGCRMFFCDATATEWQIEQYERFHARLKSLHETLEVPYAYVEWRQGLRALLGES